MALTSKEILSANLGFSDFVWLIAVNEYFCGFNYARVAELVDALDSKSSSFGSAGSIPAPGTKQSERQSESEVPHFFFDLIAALAAPRG
jgi:hypothetical protein